MTSEKRAQKFHRYSVMTPDYPDLDSASDFVEANFQPIRRTIQIWLVSRHHYRISTLVSQTSFRGKTSRMNNNENSHLKWPRKKRNNDQTNKPTFQPSTRFPCFFPHKVISKGGVTLRKFLKVDFHCRAILHAYASKIYARKSRARLRDLPYIASMLFTFAGIDARTHVRITRQWKSTLKVDYH